VEKIKKALKTIVLFGAREDKKYEIITSATSGDCMATSSSPGTHQTAPDVPAEIGSMAPTQKLPNAKHNTDFKKE
jgi:hypothetical protein